MYMVIFGAISRSRSCLKRDFVSRQAVSSVKPVPDSSVRTWTKQLTGESREIVRASAACRPRRRSYSASIRSRLALSLAANSAFRFAWASSKAAMVGLFAFFCLKYSSMDMSLIPGVDFCS